MNAVQKWLKQYCHCYSVLPVINGQRHTVEEALHLFHDIEHGVEMYFQSLRAKDKTPRLQQWLADQEIYLGFKIVRRSQLENLEEIEV